MLRVIQMNHRVFAVAAAWVVLLSPTWGGAKEDQPIQCEVVVVGATPSGIAASVAAARCGHSVLLVEAEDHIGGIVTNGLTNSDIGNTQAAGGLFHEFTRRVLRYYQSFDGTTNPDSPNVKRCRNGYWFESAVAERIFNELLTDQQGKITLLLSHEVQQASVEKGVLKAITVIDRNHPGQHQTIQSKVFIDATYEGDLAALAKVPYRVGREGRDAYGEPHAGMVFVRFSLTELLPGSTGAADAAIQAFCFRFHMTKNPANRVPVEKPKDYRRDDYQAMLADLRSGKINQLQQVIQFYQMPNDRYEINSNHPDPKTGVPSESLDLAEENWHWPEATLAERRRIYQRYLAHNVGLIWCLQNDSDIPAALREEARQFGWCKDAWATNGHLPRQVYVREGRRILGAYPLTEHDGNVDPKLQRTQVRPDSVAIAEFPFDSHGCHRFALDHPGVREGYIFIPHEPLQIPYGVLVPQRVDGLLVTVACSTSHVGYQALRMEPVFMALGEAAGIAAHVALKRGITVRTIRVAELQHLLVGRGGVITLLNDVPFDHPAFAAFQWLGARGLNTGYKAEPDRKLSRREAAERLQRVLRSEGKDWAPPTNVGDQGVRGLDVAEWLRQAGLKCQQRDLSQLAQTELNTTQFALLVYRAFRANSSR